MAANRELRDNWRLLAAASAGCGLTYAAFLNTAGLFILPMQAELGWSRSALSIGPLAGLLSALLFPLAGYLIDKVGARRIAILGTLPLAASYLLLATSGSNQTSFYLAVVLTAVTGSAASFPVFFKGLAAVFRRSLGSAIGLTMSFTSVCFALLIPLVAAAIQIWGWRSGFIALAVLLLLVVLPITFLWFSPPTDRHTGVTPTPADGDVSLMSILASRRFFLLFIVFASAAIPIGGFLGQLQPLLASRGLEPMQAAVMGSVYVTSIGVGRLVAGYLLDRMLPAAVVAGCFVIAATGAAILGMTAGLGAALPILSIAIFMIGLAQGAESDFVAFFVARLFGLRLFSMLFGILGGTTMGGGMAIGGLVFAAVFDRFGSYQIAIYGSIGMLLFAAVLVCRVTVPASQD